MPDARARSSTEGDLANPDISHPKHALLGYSGIISALSKSNFSTKIPSASAFRLPGMWVFYPSQQAEAPFLGIVRKHSHGQRVFYGGRRVLVFHYNDLTILFVMSHEIVIKSLF